MKIFNLRGWKREDARVSLPGRLMLFVLTGTDFRILRVHFSLLTRPLDQIAPSNSRIQRCYRAPGSDDMPQRGPSTESPAIRRLPGPSYSAACCNKLVSQKFLIAGSESPRYTLRPLLRL